MGEVFCKRSDWKGPNKLTAPWPWICKVDPMGDDREWFKNNDVTEPGNVPIEKFIFEKHEFSRICKQDTTKPVEPNKIHLVCENEKAPVYSGGGFGGTGVCLVGIFLETASIQVLQMFYWITYSKGLQS